MHSRFTEHELQRFLLGGSASLLTKAEIDTGLCIHLMELMWKFRRIASGHTSSCTASVTKGARRGVIPVKSCTFTSAPANSRDRTVCGEKNRKSCSISKTHAAYLSPRCHGQDVPSATQTYAIYAIDMKVLSLHKTHCLVPGFRGEGFETIAAHIHASGYAGIMQRR